jgi:phage portal protein BeeE
MGSRLQRIQSWWDGLDQPRSAQPPAVQAASHRALMTTASPLSPFTVDAMLTQTSRDMALSLPTVSRARDILCGAIAQVPLRAYLFDRVTGDLTQHPAPPTWLERPDPNRTRGALMADTVDDLMFHRLALWQITARDATTFPSAFRHMPLVEVTPHDDGTFTFRGERIQGRDVVIIESPQLAALQYGWRAIDTAVKLEDAANRFAATEVPAGWLAQTGGIPLTPEEQTAMAAQFQAARLAATVAMLSENVTWNESAYDPARLQLVESRQHSSTDLARMMNVPAPVVHAPSNDSLTYSNAQDQRADLWHFGLAPHADAIGSTLSGPNVTPRGTVIQFDPTGTLVDPFSDTTQEGASDAAAV